MNNKYDLGKLLCKLDFFVYQSQDEFIANTIYSNNSNIISNLKIGQLDDAGDIKIQDIILTYFNAYYNNDDKTKNIITYNITLIGDTEGLV